MARLTIRIDLPPSGQLGPGKARLLELIGETGSISAAGRALEMSYRRAWLLVDALNHTFREPLVSTMLGGKAGGGARLTPFGREVLLHYRRLEARAASACKPQLVALEAALAKPAGGTAPRPVAKDPDLEE
ncbi:MAG TPA: winged helix-turn-helix domain-containing protein [Stellaceae bacterium]